MWKQYLATAGLAWSALLFVVLSIGIIQLYRHYNAPIAKPTSSTLPLSAVPHITIIRPIVGLEPYLEDCLLSTFTQDYPASKLTISFCISIPNDASLPILKRVLARYPQYDARIYIETEDPNLRAEDGGRIGNLGPNPKIRNMSRAYREAVGDIIWIADCNVWLHERTAGLMVDLLCGFKNGKTTSPKAVNGIGKKYKFVHQLPLAVDVSDLPPSPESILAGTQSTGNGGLLEELFMSTAHVKFYTAISTVAIAPCTVGKSNMFRRSHLNAPTPPKPGVSGRSPGIDFFSDNICEDHLIGDLLWRTPVPIAVQQLASAEGLIPNQPQPQPPTVPTSHSWPHHALLLNPPCIQPHNPTSTSTYTARRTRWLRVRKFTVPLATLVEPATESLAACFILAWSLTTHTRIQTTFHIPQTWTSFATIYTTALISWILVDRAVWKLLQSWRGDSKGDVSPAPVFVGSAGNRRWGVWVRGWLVREVLALPVWGWAVFCGRGVVWRGRGFVVGVDMTVRSVDDSDKGVERSKAE